MGIAADLLLGNMLFDKIIIKIGWLAHQLTRDQDGLYKSFNEYLYIDLYRFYIIGIE